MDVSSGEEEEDEDVQLAREHLRLLMQIKKVKKKMGMRDRNVI